MTHNKACCEILTARSKAGGLASGDNMASIRKEILVNAPSQAVWDALKDVGALHTRLVPGFVTDTRLEPGARVVTFGNGQVVRELIVDLNEKDRRLVWAVVDKPFQHYNASAQVFDEGPCEMPLCLDGRFASR